MNNRMNALHGGKLLREFRKDQEPAVEDIRNALQLILNLVADDDGTISMGAGDFGMVVSRLQSAIRKLEVK